MAIYDLCNNLFDKEFLHLNIDVEHGEDEEYAFIGLGLELGFSFRKSRDAYKKAKLHEKLMNERRYSKQKMLLASSEKTKILLVGHPYNLYDNYVGREIIEFLEHEDIDILFSDNYDPKYLEVDYKKIAPKNYYTYNKELLASIAFYQNFVDGIILISAFPCGPDSLSNEMIIRTKKTPLLVLTIDELDSNTGLITRLESFIDILKERRDINE